MIDIKDIEYIKNLQSDLRTPQGQQIIAFLEEACGYDNSVFVPTDRDMVLINDGKRQVVATLKTLLKLTPEQFVKLVKTKEE
jgi:hypothetical protein